MSNYKTDFLEVDSFGGASASCSSPRPFLPLGAVDSLGNFIAITSYSHADNICKILSSIYIESGIVSPIEFSNLTNNYSLTFASAISPPIKILCLHAEK